MDQPDQPALSSNDRATCQQHGLHFDPRTQSGCVVCRRPSTQPAPMAAAGSAWAPIAPAAPQRKAPVALLVGVGLVAAVACGSALYGVAKVVVEAQQATREQIGSRTLGTPHLSKDGLIRLWVPQSWHEEKPDEGDATLALLQPGDRLGVMVVSEPASDLAADLSLAQYMNLLKTGYGQNNKYLSVHSFEAPTPFVIDGHQALRLAFTGKIENQDIRGYLYATEGPSHFHHFMGFCAPWKFDGGRSDFDRIVTNAELVTAR